MKVDLSISHFNSAFSSFILKLIIVCTYSQDCYVFLVKYPPYTYEMSLFIPGNIPCSEIFVLCF